MAYRLLPLCSTGPEDLGRAVVRGATCPWLMSRLLSHAKVSPMICVTAPNPAAADFGLSGTAAACAWEDWVALVE